MLTRTWPRPECLKALRGFSLDWVRTKNIYIFLYTLFHWFQWIKSSRNTAKLTTKGKQVMMGSLKRFWLHCRNMSDCNILWPQRAQWGIILPPSSHLKLVQRRQGSTAPSTPSCGFERICRACWPSRQVSLSESWIAKVCVHLCYNTWIPARAASLVVGQKAWAFDCRWITGLICILWPLSQLQLFHCSSSFPPPTSKRLQSRKHNSWVGSNKVSECVGNWNVILSRPFICNWHMFSAGYH